MKIANGMEFVNDENVIGKWEIVGWIDNPAHNSLDNLSKKVTDIMKYTFCRRENLIGYLKAGQKDIY